MKEKEKKRVILQMSFPRVKLKNLIFPLIPELDDGNNIRNHYFLNMKEKIFNPLALGAIIGGVMIAGFVVYAYVRIVSLEENVRSLTSELASTTTAFGERADALAGAIQALEQKAQGLAGTLSEAERNIQTTKQNVEEVQSQVKGAEQTIEKIGGAVGTLEKLSKTDPELLQKYSKIFFLSEHYAPERLSEIDKEYLYSEKKSESINSLVLPYLNGLLNTAKGGGVTLYVKSAYRSFDEQKSVKSSYTVVYGAGNANQFSADQGYSEHQLGTTVDFITTGLGGELAGFENTSGYAWMKNNAHKYGFILSYPANNGYYIFEPWHWRFVGVALAARLKTENKNFYDLEQREIDTYLANIFD
mgnify:CR=1 FL=1